MNSGPYFASLSKYRDELNRLLDSHQRALVVSDVDLALAALTQLGTVLQKHVDFEERRVLPLYADQGAEKPGGTLAIFQAEHRKLLDTFSALIQKTELLYTSKDLPGSILQLLDDETAFKGLLHHHAAREEKHLFPKLDEQATAEERETWLFGNLIN